MTETNRVVYSAVAASLPIAVAKFAAAFATGSSAMLNEDSLNVAIQFDRTLTTAAIEEAVVRIEEKVREQYPVVKRVHVVPESVEE